MLLLMVAAAAAWVALVALDEGVPWRGVLPLLILLCLSLLLRDVWRNG